MSSPSATSDRREFHELARRTGMRSFSTPARAEYRCAQLFRGVPLRGRRVLDVGAGWGLYSAYAALEGASEVLAMEPELDGATRGYAEGIRRTARAMGLDQLQVSNETFQSWDPDGRRFDVVLMNAVVNHLDEEACMALPDDADAREAYRAIFDKVATVLEPGGEFIVTDASSRNLFGDRGWTAPLARSIEWDKHQPPEVWLELLEASGFEYRSLDWYVHHELRHLKWIFGRPEVAYCTNSLFRLVIRAP